MALATHPEERLSLDLLGVLLTCPQALLRALLEELGKRTDVHWSPWPQALPASSSTTSKLGPRTSRMGGDGRPMSHSTCLAQPWTLQ